MNTDALYWESKFISYGLCEVWHAVIGSTDANILDAFEIQLPQNPQKFKILKIGSHWENLERKGDWSKNSEVLPEEIKKILFKENAMK